MKINIINDESEIASKFLDVKITDENTKLITSLCKVINFVEITKKGGK